MHDEVSGSIFAHAVPHKGTDHPEVNLVVRAVVRDLYSLGYKKILIKDDQEAALVAFLQFVRRALACEIIFEMSPVGEAESHGAIERAVQTVQEFCRTLRDALEARLGSKLAADSPVMTWLVTHAAAMHRRYSISADGRTAYQRNKGKVASTTIAELGEKVWYRPLTQSGQRLPVAAARYEPGCFIGINELTNEVLLVAENGNMVNCLLYTSDAADE